MYERWLPHLLQRVGYMGRTRRGSMSTGHTISLLIATGALGCQDANPDGVDRRLGLLPVWRHWNSYIASPTSNVLAIAALRMFACATMPSRSWSQPTLGLAAIIGAFLAGMVFAEAREHFDLEHQALPIYRFLVPFFFVLTGAQVDWRLFLEGGIVGVARAVTALALLEKVVGCGLVVLGLGGRSVAIIGVAMAPRGEVGRIVASLGLSLGAILSQIFSVVVIMSILTTLVVPPILRALYAGHPETDISEEDAESQAGRLPDL